MPGIGRSAGVVRFEDFELQVRSGELFKAGNRILRLSEQPLRVLLALLEHPGELVRREDLRKRLWPNDTVVEFEHGIGSAMNRLRQALGDSADNPRFIETLARRGYRWKTQVEWGELPVPDKAPAPVPTQNLVGKRVGQYRVLEVLGGGGMGVVYKAEDIKLGRRVALKFLPDELSADPLALERFRREARAASASDHPNICTIYEVGEHEGMPYIAMQLLTGEPLSERIGRKSGPLPMADVISLAIQVTDGLDAAHQQGIIHRDIKPANIFVTHRNEAKILDFGLAKLSDSSEPLETPLAPGANSHAHPYELNLTRAGAALGTAAYMSPEQIRCEKLDARTDLFSFGLVLYEMATGRRAFAQNSATELHDAVIHQTPEPAPSFNPEVSSCLEAIIEKLLRKDRESRYQSATELRSDLEALRNEVAPPSAEHARSAATRRRWQWFAYVSSGLLVVLLVFGRFWVARRNGSLRPELKLSQLTRNSTELPVRSAAISPDGKYLAYTDRDGIHIKSISSNEILTLPEPELVRNETVHWLVSSWFPDSTRFVAQIAPLDEGGPGGWSTWVASALGGPPRKIHEGSVAESISPDGSLIAFTTELGVPGGKEIWLMDAAGDNPRRLFETGASSWMRFARWSPDGKRLAYIHVEESHGKDWTLESRDIQGGPPVVILPHANAVSHDYEWLPNGDIIYGMDEPGGNGCNFWKVRVDTPSGRPRSEPQKATNWAGFCLDSTSATADGKRLVFTKPNEQRAIYVADVQDGRAQITIPKRFSLSEGSNFPAGWTSDSQSLIFISTGAGTSGVFKQRLKSEVVETILSSLGPGWGESITPDGKWLLYVAAPTTQDPDTRTVMRLSTAGGRAQPVLSGRIRDISCAQPPATYCLLVEESSDSRQLTLSALDPMRGRLREFCRIDPIHVALSPDGTRVALFNGQGPIRILSLSDGRVRQFALKDWSDAEDVTWAVNGQGLYVSSLTNTGAVLLYSDLNGRTKLLWEYRGGLATRGIPSPDGRHLAIEGWSLGSNVWMMEDF